MARPSCSRETRAAATPCSPCRCRHQAGRRRKPCSACRAASSCTTWRATAAGWRFAKISPSAYARKCRVNRPSAICHGSDPRAPRGCRPTASGCCWSMWARVAERTTASCCGKPMPRRRCASARATPRRSHRTGSGHRRLSPRHRNSSCIRPVRVKRFASTRGRLSATNRRTGFRTANGCSSAAQVQRVRRVVTSRTSPAHRPVRCRPRGSSPPWRPTAERCCSPGRMVRFRCHRSMAARCSPPVA